MCRELIDLRQPRHPRSRRAGAVIARACVMIALDGIEILTKGWLVRRHTGGFVQVEAPSFRDPVTGGLATAIAAEAGSPDAC